MLECPFESLEFLECVISVVGVWCRIWELGEKWEQAFEHSSCDSIR